MSNTQCVDIYELTCYKCGHVFRIVNDDRQELYEEYCPECNTMLPCDNDAVIVHSLCSLIIDLDTFKVVETIVYTKEAIPESDS